ncbi:MAG: insulinase family protein, partial [Oscillospiraceae bacterium]|nr:insulinase family protein [Oscillospiraceae bacterium]
MELGKTYTGFILKDEREIGEIGSIGYLFLHEKTGARLLYLKNSDDNKVFGITFRTPPKDSTGVAHIIEHTVLSGSRKYPLKEPFVELLKGSLATFVNALTYPDKTVYPVASRNDKDFNNLMDVYLDGVFYPNIYKSKISFMQEGWHYEIENKESDLSYKGVVYNEMKGFFSTPESLLFRRIMQSLFQNGTYNVECGGDPDFIPNLTYEDFIEFHKKYYHPSNSYTFLYGDMDIEEKLKYIDEEYFSHFDEIEVLSNIEYKTELENLKEYDYFYSVTNNETMEDKTYLSLNFALGDTLDCERTLAYNMLEDILFEMPSSPLKKALIEADLGKDVFGYCDPEIKYCTMGVVVKNAEKEKRERFKEVFFNTLKKLLAKGIDKKLIEGVVNSKEFKLREANFGGYPKGIIYGLRSLTSWLYGGDPYEHLFFEEALKAIKKDMFNGYFEKIIEEKILNCNHCSLLILSPEKGLTDKKEKELSNKLSGIKGSLSEDELNEIINNTKELIKRQGEPDTKEALDTLPKLKIEDLDKNIEKYPIEIEKLNDGAILYHDIFTNGIAYINLYFDGNVVLEEDIPYLKLISSLLGNIDTKSRDYMELSNYINIFTGGINSNIDLYVDSINDDKLNPKFTIASRVLISKLDDFKRIILEMLNETQFTNKKRLIEVLNELKSRIEMEFISGGHVTTFERAWSYLSKAGKYNDYVKGIGFYDFIVSAIENIDDKFEEYSAKLSEIFKKLINKESIIASFTCDDASRKQVENTLKEILAEIPTLEREEIELGLEFKKLNEGLMTSS